MFAIAGARGEFGRFHPSAISGESAAWWVYLVVAGSVLAFTAYVWLLQNAPISLVATYAYVNPTVAVVLGALLLNERITWPVLAGGGVVIASVAIVVSVEHGSKAPAEPVAAASAPDAPPVSVD
jgi:drug/metabolite transporter (DMT)-like permease